MIQSNVPGTATCKVIYDGTNNCMSITSPTGKFIVFTPIWIGVSRATLELFGRCEHAHQWKRYGVDCQEFTCTMPIEVMRDCLALANGQTDTAEASQAA